MAEMRLTYPATYEQLRPVVIELRQRSGCSLATARTVVARHIRKTRGIAAMINKTPYRVMSITNLPHPADAEPVPLVLVAEQP